MWDAKAFPSHSEVLQSFVSGNCRTEAPEGTTYGHARLFLTIVGPRFPREQYLGYQSFSLAQRGPTEAFSVRGKKGQIRRRIDLVNKT
jgi:hypothetical protein